MYQCQTITEVSPWENKEEFERVYQCLYDIDLTGKRWAVDQISVWQTRRYPTLPTGIEATVAIVRAIIQDVLLKHNATLCQPSEISMMYSMALIRFVNLITELDQNKGSKIPVRVIAEQNGIPSWLVALRNDASHSTYPSLVMLRNGADAALLWLDDHFWKKELLSFTNLIKLSETAESSISEAISQFQAEQYDLLYLISAAQTKERKVHIKAVLCEIRILMKKHNVKFFEIFVKPGFFIPTYKNLEALLHDSEMSYIENDSVELPDSLERFWLPIIKIIVQLDLIQNFLEVLLQSQKEKDVLYQKVVVTWALKILKSAIFTGEDTRKRSPIMELFGEQKVEFHWLRLLNVCFKYPCKYSPVLLPLMASYLKLSDEQISDLMYLVAIVLGQAILKLPIHFNPEQRLFTVERLKKTKVLEDSVKKGETPTAKTGTWELAPETMEFSAMPLGKRFGESSNTDAIMAQEEVIAIVEETSKTCQNSENEDVEHYIINNEEDNIQIEDCTVNIGDPQRNATVKKLANIFYPVAS